VPHVIREQRIRQRLNWFRKAQEFGSVTDACVFFGIFRKTYYKWWHRYAASSCDRLSFPDRARRPPTATPCSGASRPPCTATNRIAHSGAESNCKVTALAVQYYFVWHHRMEKRPAGALAEPAPGGCNAVHGVLISHVVKV